VGSWKCGTWEGDVLVDDVAFAAALVRVVDAESLGKRRALLELGFGSVGGIALGHCILENSWGPLQTNYQHFSRVTLLKAGRTPLMKSACMAETDS
jgi:hypothetical protein